MGSRWAIEGWLFRVLVFAFLQTLGLQAIRPMVAYRALDLGADAIWIGVIASSYALFSFLAAVPIGRRIERWGEPWVLVAGTAIVIVSTAALLVIDSLGGLAVSQSFFGLGQVMIVVGSQALVGNAGDPRDRDRRYGALTVTVSLGQLIAPAAAGLIAGGGFATGVVDSSAVDTHSVFLLATLTACLAFCAAVSMIVWKPTGAGPRPGAAAKVAEGNSFRSMREVLVIPGMRRALLVGMSVITTIDILTAYLPAFAQEVGMSVQTVGFLLATRATAGIVSRIGVVRLIQLLGRRNLLLVAVVAAGVSLALFPFVPLPLRFVAIFVVGLGLGVGQPTMLSWVAGRAPRSLRGTALGVRVSGNRLAQIFVPAAIGLLAGVAGIAVVFVAMAASLFASAAVLYSAQFELPEDPED